MNNDNWTMRKRSSLGNLATLLFVAGLSGCASMSGQPDPTAPLKKAVDITATAAVEVLSASQGSTISDAWQDGGGTWHWTKVEQGVGTFECEGRQVGIPKQCNKVSGP